MSNQSNTIFFEIRVPDIGDSGPIELAKWNYCIGDTIKSGDDILELVTDKCAFPLESPIKGKIIEVFKSQGEVVRVNDLLGRMEIYP